MFFFIALNFNKMNKHIDSIKLIKLRKTATPLRPGDPERGYAGDEAVLMRRISTLVGPGQAKDIGPLLFKLVMLEHPASPP